jgi:uncharacterized membrane protein
MKNGDSGNNPAKNQTLTGGISRMFKKSIVLFSLLAVLAGVIALSGCSSGSNSTISTIAKSKAGPYPVTEVTPTLNNGSVSIPVSLIESNSNVHFSLVTPEGNTSFIAYVYDGAIQVRASYCVPCRGTTFTLSGDKLICDNCGTVFSAKDGIGVSGVPACKSYPKAGVQFTTTGGNIVMQNSDLITAFKDTVTRV